MKLREKFMSLNSAPNGQGVFIRLCAATDPGCLAYHVEFLCVTQARRVGLFTKSSMIIAPMIDGRNVLSGAFKVIVSAPVCLCPESWCYNRWTLPPLHIRVFTLSWARQINAKTALEGVSMWNLTRRTWYPQCRQWYLMICHIIATTACPERPWCIYFSDEEEWKFIPVDRKCRDSL